ncbi:uncharacterized protein LOC135398828 [Ornithodoros turicata]|uniref:uncharacterized protein LOC135398828 n=1 Tax=Ornithodoros turicata TaxID=34597 RepID=UPI003138D387
MNSAAVIGRQLRQQNTGRGAPPARGRAPSHVNLVPGQQPSTTTATEAKEAEPGRVSLRCIWEACKALSGGIFLIIVGTVMCVVGFFAEDLATSPVQRHNVTVLQVDPNTEYHLHNLSLVGPAIMGLGGIFIVAACVLTFEVKDRPHRVVPVDEKRPSAAEVLIPVLAKTPYLTVPSVWTTADNNVAAADPSEPPRSLIIPHPNNPSTTTTTTTTNNPLPSTSSRCCSRTYNPPYRASLSSTSTCTTQFLLSPRYEDHFLPSPADLQIQDPDGCETPDSLASVQLELCGPPRPFNIAQRLFASIESDGLSDSDDEVDVIRDLRTARFPGPHSSEDQVVPLLGRCSPPDFLFPHRRDGPKRFPLLRQSAATSDGCSRGLNGRTVEEFVS